MTVDQLADFNNFLLYGMNILTLDQETESDVFQALLQGRRMLFYDRSYGTEAIHRENYPNGISLQIVLRSSIVQCLQQRNTEVSQGQDGLPDRRVAVSQNTIAVQQNSNNIDIDVKYIPLANINDFRKVQASL